MSGQEDESDDDEIDWVHLLRTRQIRIVSANSYYRNVPEQREESKHYELQKTLDADKDSLEEFSQRVKLDAGMTKQKNVHHKLLERENSTSFSAPQKRSVLNAKLANCRSAVMRFNNWDTNRMFCTRFSQSGDRLCVACPEGVAIHDTDTWKEIRRVHAGDDTGWAIIDMDYSPDGRWCAYSAWSTTIHLVNLYGDNTLHNPHNLLPDHYGVCMFGVRFAPDNRHIITGCQEGVAVVYDLEKQKTISSKNAHQMDINSVCYIDQSSNIYATGSDDCLIKVWDIRTHNEAVGAFVGHEQGLTCVSTKGDGIYVLSNGKDQCMKLWDMRKVTPMNQVNELEHINRGRSFDYRRRQWPRNSQPRIPQDHSIMTYVGHGVFRTLIRCYFSPMFSTGQRYVYSGSASGGVYIYDALSGELVRKLGCVEQHRSIIRDVSWHPIKPIVVGSSWDGTVLRYTYREHPEEAMVDDQVAEDDGYGNFTYMRFNR